MTLAVDFGTSNTVVARWNEATEQAETLTLGNLSIAAAANPPLVPSLIYVESFLSPESPRVVVGQPVRDRGLDIAQDSRFFRNFKRGIGTDIRGFLPDIDGHTVDFETVGKAFLNRVIAQLSAVGPLDSLVFTVPVDSFEVYRNWLGQVCGGLNVQQVRLLDEPTAAALGYGLQGGETLLVIDFGGGTLDFALVQLAMTAGGKKPVGFLLKSGDRSLAAKSGQRVQTARVLAKAGENLGGADIDNWIADYFAETQGLGVSPLTLRLAERLKIALSAQTQASEVYFNDETFESLELSLDRDRFEAILQANQFFDRLDARLDQVLQQARGQGLTATDIDAVLLVGGTAQIPAVQRWVAETFGSEQIHSDRPFEAIAHGALQIAQGLQVKDFLYHSYGIRYWDRRHNRHSWHPIILQGQPYPMDKPVELYLGASTEQQPSIELILGELGQEQVTTEVYFEGDRLVTRQVASGNRPMVQPLNDRDGARTIARLDPPGFPGSDRIKVLFDIDRQRRLRITVEDILTGETLIDQQPVVQLS
ncbi:MAG: Hsp70 family protein [Cyanobacteria bacterium P01_D01_bin.128]